MGWSIFQSITETDPTALQESANLSDLSNVATARTNLGVYSKAELDGGQLDTRYFAEAEFIDLSAGAGDAGKPVKLDAGGAIDASMLNAGDIDHDALLNFVANEHIDWTAASAGTIDPSNYVDNDTTDHTLLSNIGTNSHNDIDNHISSVANPHSVTAAQAGALALDGSNSPSAAIGWGNQSLNDVASLELDDGVNPPATIGVGADGWTAPEGVIDGFYFQGTSLSNGSTLWISEVPAPTTISSGNVVIGKGAGASMDTGGNLNTYIGSGAGAATTNGNRNVAIGRDAFGSSGVGVDNGVHIGFAAGKSVTANRMVNLGYQAGRNITEPDAISIGFGSNLNATTIQGTISIGKSAGQDSDGQYNIFMGVNAGRGHTAGSNIQLGHQPGVTTSQFTTSTATNQMIVGTSAHPITDVYLGEGGKSATPQTVTIHGTNADGTDIAGADVALAAGASTGAAVGGSVLVQTTPAGVSGSTVNSLSTLAEFTGDQKIGFFGVTPVAQAADPVALTDNSGGTADSTIAAVSGSGADATINDNFADLAAKYNTLRDIIRSLGFAV